MSAVALAGMDGALASAPLVDPDRRAHQYRLRFDDGTEELVTASGPAAAVEARQGRRLPQSLTDLTALEVWAGKRWP